MAGQKTDQCYPLVLCGAFRTHVLDQDAFALFHIENAPRCKSGRVGSVGGERGNVGGEHCWGLALHMPADLARSGLSGRKAKMMKSGETTEDRDGVS